mmetsp:Transcript_5805/g.17347  ORF Transcript_5805/g.17347 Transcript_5805/m.17347 type:complete len:1077 (+) Transcript_5805:172-3402(+)
MAERAIFTNNEPPTWEDMHLVLIVGAVTWVSISLYMLLCFLVVHVYRRSRRRLSEEIDKVFNFYSIRNTVVYWIHLRLRAAATFQIWFGQWPANIRVVADTTVIVLYFIGSFQHTMNRVQGALLFSCGVIIAINLVMEATILPLERDVRHWIYAPETVCEALAAPSIILTGVGIVSYINLNFLISIPWYSSVVISQFRSRRNDPRRVFIGKGKNSVVKQYVFYWAFFIFCVSLVFAGIMMSLEILGDPVRLEENRAPRVNGWSFLTAIEFSIVTFTTVGYGNLTPTSYPGVVFMALVVIFGIFYISYRVSLLITQVQKFRSGGGSYHYSLSKYLRTSHVVVMGPHRFCDFLSFATAFYSYIDNADAKIILLARDLGWSVDEHNALRQSHISSLVTFISGLPVDLNDRERAGMSNAGACFIMAPLETDDIELQDSLNIVRASNTRMHNSKIPMFVMHRRQTSKPLIYRSLFSVDDEGLVYRNGESIGFDSYTASMVATTLRCRGFSSLLSNLLMEWRLEADGDDLPWLIEYKRGAQNSIHVLMCTKEAYGQRLIDLALEVFEHAHMVLVAAFSEDSKFLSVAEYAETSVDGDYLVYVIGTLNQLYHLLETHDYFKPLRTHQGRVDRHVLRKPAKEEREEMDQLITMATPWKDPAEEEEKHCGSHATTEATPTTDSDEEPAVDLAPADILMMEADKSIEGHIAVIGFSTKSLKLVETILEADDSLGSMEMRLLMPGVDKADRQSLQAHCRNVKVFCGNPLEYKCIKRLNISKARVVLILMQEVDSNVENSESRDSRVALTVLLVEALLSTVDHDKRPEILAMSQDMDLFGHLDIRRNVTKRNKHMAWLSHYADDDEIVAAVDEVDDGAASTHSRGSTTTTANVLSNTDSVKSYMKDFNKSRRKAALQQEMRTVMDGFDNNPGYCNERYVSGAILVTSFLPAIVGREISAPGTLMLCRKLMRRKDGPYLSFVKVPDAWNDRTWEELYRVVLKHGGMTIGLLRSGQSPICMHHTKAVLADVGHCDSPKVPQGFNESPWVYTNPAPCTVLSSQDKMYLFAHDPESIEERLSSFSFEQVAQS